jgi:MFS family permease
VNELLRYPAYVRFWLARVVSVSAQQMLMLVIGWHMYESTGSVWDLGLVGLFQFLPAVATTLVAGQLADRVHRGRLVAACLCTQATAAALLAAASLAHLESRELLLAMSVLLGGLRPFQMSAQQALLPALVPAALLGRATAFSSASQQAAVIGGPALGGLLLISGTTTVYATCAACFVAAALGCWFIRYAHVPPAPEPVSGQSVLAGLVFVRSNPVVLGAISLDLFAVLLGGATALLPVFAKDVLHVGPQALGLLRAAPAVGALVVGLTLARYGIQRSAGRTLLRAVAVYGLCMIVFGLSTSFVLSLVALAISGGADMVSVVVRQTLVQLATPDAMRGRVAAVNTLFIGASNQLGEFESGVTAAAFGPVASVVLGGLGTLAVSLAWRRLFRPLAELQKLG